MWKTAFLCESVRGSLGQKEKALRVEVPFFVVWVVVLSHQNKKEEKMSNKIFLAVAEIVAVGVAAFVILKVFGIW